MASNIDKVEHVSHSEPAIDGKDNARIMCEKMGSNELVVEIQESERRRPHLGDYARNLGDVFSKQSIRKYAGVLVKFGKFVGPAGIISVAYIDPDNFQTSISSGVQFKFKLLFMVLVSNLIAIFLQSLSVKLGSVTGMDLAQMNKAYLPRWLNIGLWFVAEASIIATDIGQVIGTAIAINILVPKIPLTAGCALSIVDTLFILYFYRPDGSMRGLRLFELFVGAFVAAIFICFCIELSYIKDTPVGHVFKGFLPSKAVFKGEGLYQSCAILGGTLMPHTIYLGTGLAQPRLREFDVRNDTYKETFNSPKSSALKLYKPSLSAIKACMNYSIAELIVTLFIISVFVNSAILIIAAASLTEEAGEADLWGMYDLFQDSISKAAGTIFALSLLFSGISAGIVATMAGQMVFEGAFNWTIRPFYRRLITRVTALIPGIIIAAVLGRDGVAAALNGANVVLSVALIFLTFPLIWYTNFNKYMMVETESAVSVETFEVLGEGDIERVEAENPKVSMANNWPTAIAGGIIWVIIAFMNIATLTLLGLGIVQPD
ncbi:related to manganese transport protein [Rhynchosporium agropyri]|uniref:Related to manganese transport protein n=1 Tax=Rhynchosporium agropyri TaxID=914238 RepID=A0A1E1L3M1_9HELO|nr:related to manganese transport protein [Rhynchosporium agropyri]